MMLPTGCFRKTRRPTKIEVKKKAQSDGAPLFGEGSARKRCVKR